ncbi:pilus assembly protein [Kocuria rosea subsp. polaris]|uniref:Pilus assembly protein n=1 Tax=Kocuria rosea subsp. polaris TaxID=136273 RepID=A0A0W8IQA1_KOCRO|nr:Flp family type IVb pilin [Kocuria polaris]KUG61987.1 pilus assembly protein [Kocuria polaris]
MLPLFITLQTIFGDAKARLSGEEKGATAVEYGLLIGLVAIVLVGAIALLGGPFVTMMEGIIAQLP